MKTIKRTIAIILCLLLMMSTTTAFATGEQLTEGNYVYEVNKEEAAIIKYKGNEKDIVIPSTLGNYPVTKIKDSAFRDNETIESLDVGNVKEIGYFSFENCKKLATINLRNVEIMYAGAFSKCGALMSIEIPKSVKKAAYAILVLSRKAI